VLFQEGPVTRRAVGDAEPACLENVRNGHRAAIALRQVRLEDTRVALRALVT
jgi:hypothetical protein